MSAGTGDILYMHTVIQHIMYKATASLESTFCLSVVFFFFFTISSAQLNFYSKILGEQVVIPRQHC